MQFSAVLLNDDPAGAIRFAKNISGRLNRQIDVLAYSPDGRDGPGAYGLNRNVSQTILFASDGEVRHNFVFAQGMLYPDPHVLGALAELLGQERETLAGWLNEEPPVGDGGMQAAREADGEATDRRTALRERLGEFVEAGKLSRQEAIELYRIAFPEPAERSAENPRRDRE